MHAVEKQFLVSHHTSVTGPPDLGGLVSREKGVPPMEFPSVNGALVFFQQENKSIRGQICICQLGDWFQQSSQADISSFSFWEVLHV